MSGTYGSLFSGCLGLDLGLEVAGWEPAWGCENDEACRRVIARHRPDLHVYDDVRELPADAPEVDLLAGGFPCQDLSYAGRGRGLDGDRSALWFEFARAIRLLRPRLVLVENVPGLATRGLGRVLYDLAEAGYVGSWVRLGAADLGAPHRRERIFIVAADAGGRRQSRWGRPDPSSSSGGRCDGRAGAARHSAPAADTSEGGCRRQSLKQGLSEAGRDGVGGHGQDAADPEHERPLRGDAERDVRDGRAPVGATGAAGPAGRRQTAADADGLGRWRPGAGGWATENGGSPWGPYGHAIQRWESVLGRAAPRPTDVRGRLNPEFVEWMLGFPEGWTDGEKRTHRLRMLGNSVQVQCGEYMGAILMEALLSG